MSIQAAEAPDAVRIMIGQAIVGLGTCRIGGGVQTSSTAARSAPMRAIAPAP